MGSSVGVGNRFGHRPHIDLENRLIAGRGDHTTFDRRVMPL
jgi:hypothetical protein